MPWFKVDDRFHAHPKVLALRTGAYESEALAVWAKSGSWCMSNLTDGAIPRFVVETLLRKNAVKGADELVRVRLWEVTEDGYRFRKWGEYQPSKDAVVTKRQKTATKVSSWRERNRVTDEVGNQVTREHVTTPVTLPPTRPDPTHTQESASALSAREAPPPEATTPRHPTGVRAESLRTGYVERFQRAMPGIGLPAVAGPGNGGPWLEVAREVTDEQVPVLLDAFFADCDPFVAKDRSPSKLVGQRVRLLTQGPSQPRAARGQAKAASHEEFARLAAEGSDVRF